MKKKNVLALAFATSASLLLSGCGNKLEQSAKDIFRANAGQVVGGGWDISKFRLDFPEYRHSAKPKGENNVQLERDYNEANEPSAQRRAQIAANYRSTYAEAARKASFEGGNVTTSSVTEFLKAKGCLQQDVACKPFYQKGYEITVRYEWEEYDPCYTTTTTTNSDGSTSSQCQGGWRSESSSVGYDFTETQLEGLQLATDTGAQGLVDALMGARQEAVRRWRAQAQREAAEALAKSPK